MRLYDGRGNLIVEGTLSQRLLQMITADGFMEINYKDPKDPRKVGVWSDTTAVRPVRIASLVDKQVEHLATPQLVSYLCFCRSLYWLVATNEKRGIMEKIPPGRFWCNDTQTGADGWLLPLQAQTLASLVAKMMGRAGVQVGRDESEGASDVVSKPLSLSGRSVHLAGHFLRGHAGSLALDLAYHGATWRTDEGINRARHTFPTFFKSYYRATVKRHVIAFQAVQATGVQLRFEEAALL